MVKFIKTKQGSAPEELVKYIDSLVFYDRIYFYALYQKFWQEEKFLKIGKNFIPTALLKPKVRKTELNLVDYSEIEKDSSLANYAKKVNLICNPMDGGLGTSLSRINYLKRIWKDVKKRGKPRLGAKGGDLYFSIEANGAKEKINITEIKYLQAIQESQFYQKIIIEELVNEESIESINEFLDETINIWDRIDKQPKRNNLNYRQLISKNKKIDLADKMIAQAALPTIKKENNQLNVERLAPGGHGQLGSMVLAKAAQAKSSFSDNLIRTIYNGDGPNNFPDRKIIGFMVKRRIPLVMITSTKTPIDQKGGQIGLELSKGREKTPQILELAQAENIGQDDLFKKIGIEKNNPAVYGEVGKQYFNTNIALINYSVLSPFLKDLYDLIGTEKFSKVIAPDLIKNHKNQNNKTYIQLEGALASTFLNLASFIKTTESKKIKKLLKKHNIDNFLVMINIGKKKRAFFFTPVKFAWDFWFYAYSDHFKLNLNNFKLENLRPGHFPRFRLGHFYQDLENCLKAFGNASTIDLESLAIDGKVLIKNAKLVGSITIKNESKEIINLNTKAGEGNFGHKDGNLFLKDIKIVVKPNKEIGIEKLTG